MYKLAMSRRRGRGGKRGKKINIKEESEEKPCKEDDLNKIS